MTHDDDAPEDLTPRPHTLRLGLSMRCDATGALYPITPEEHAVGFIGDLAVTK